MTPATKNNGKLIKYFYLKKYVLLLLLLFTAITVSAQDFTLTLTPTPENCNGNGSLSFAVQGAQPNLSITYRVYRMPDATNAMAQTTANSLEGLEAGEYLVTATQTINGVPVIATNTAQIADETTPLTIVVASTNSTCGNDGSLTVTLTGGTATQYQIISGPVTRPLQPGATFANIPSGVYEVRATNNCGDAAVVTHTLLTNGPEIYVGEMSVPQSLLPACDMIKIAHRIQPIGTLPLAYPFTVEIKVYPPGGGVPVTYSQTVAGGDPVNLVVEQVIPFYYDVDYYFDLKITFPCGIFVRDHNLVREKLITAGGFEDAGCAKQYLIVGVKNYRPPYTLTFTEYPAGFNPATLNPQYPGPFTEGNVAFGGEGIPVPFGNYEFTVSDGCGRTAEGNINLMPPFAEPRITIYPGSCTSNMGAVEIFIPLVILDTATIIDAPDEYEQTLPYDVSHLINKDDKLKVEDMPAGTYLFKLTDECGGTWEREVIISQALWSALQYNYRPDCTVGKSTIRVFSYNPPLTDIIITDAPEGFQYTVPYNATSLLIEGQLYMDNLPPGNYKFSASDSCADDLVLDLSLTAYEVNSTAVEITPHCGSFDLYFNHDITVPSPFLGYWLQKEIAPGVWGHPETNEPYIEGTPPDANDSYAILSGDDNLNLEYIGRFRIVKRYQAFGNSALGALKECIEVLEEFDFTGELEILKVKSLSCPGEIPSVELFTNGVDPINYRITHKNSLPYTIENGYSTIFTGLQQAVYTFQAEDSCGRQSSRSFNVGSLPPLVAANTPANIGLCDEGSDGTEIFSLSQLNSTILGLQNPADYIVTYHATQQDATAGTNILPGNYPSGNATVYARVQTTSGSGAACHAITSFQLALYSKPTITIDDTYTFCEGAGITITAPPGFTGYKWAYGTTVQHLQAITVNQPGQYTLTVTNANGCEASKTITVIASPLPHIASISMSDWSESNNTITVVTETSALPQYFEYSLDGINYQDSPVFEHLAPGPYTVYVRDIYRCGFDDGDVFLLSYPRFFTPNGDGENDRWRIKFSQMEPDMKIYIFDRYGKLITSFGANDTGWDGTYNGARLPATDYWFVVTRQDGRELKGHFSMLR